MIPLDNYISNTLYSDTQEDLHAVLTYLDINTVWTVEQFNDMILLCISKNPILNKCIENINGKLYLETDISLNITDNYCIKHIPSDKFDTEIYAMLNKPLILKKKWFFLYCIDKKENTSRLFFKISHVYADGYQIIKILTSLLSDEEENITERFKRSTPRIYNQLYYFIIGTILLLIKTSCFLFKMLKHYFFTNIKETHTSIETDYIVCKGFEFDKIKSFTKRENITVNDFLYSLMIKSSYFYSDGKDKIIYAGSPFNVSKMSSTNNVIPVILNVRNNLDSKTLLQNVHEMFNCCKYSMFIPLLHSSISFFSKFIPLHTCSSFHKFIFENIDYNYTNIIGSKEKCRPNVTNARFLTTTIKEEICFNIISFDNVINIICTFKNGVVKDKKKLEESIYEAYNVLLGNSICSACT